MGERPVAVIERQVIQRFVVQGFVEPRNHVHLARNEGHLDWIDRLCEGSRA